MCSDLAQDPHDIFRSILPGVQGLHAWPSLCDFPGFHPLIFCQRMREELPIQSKDHNMRSQHREPQYAFTTSRMSLIVSIVYDEEGAKLQIRESQTTIKGL